MNLTVKRRIVISIFVLILMVCYSQSFLVYADDNDPDQTAYAMTIEGDYIYIVGNAIRLAENLPVGSLNLSGKMEDIWLVKLRKDGTPIFQALIGGSQSDTAYGVSVYQGIVYIIGETWSSDFPAAPGSAGENDAIILALAADGSGILWARRFGGSDQDAGRAISFDNNSIYFTGITWSKDFISGQAKGDADGFVGRIETNGSLTWLQVFGGNLLDAPQDIAITSSQVWITGQTFSFNFGGAPIGGCDIFLKRFSTDGQSEYSGLYGGRGEDLAFSLSLIEGGGIFVTGGTQSSDLPLPLGQYVDGFDAFIMKINAENDVVFSTYLGGNGNDYGYDTKTLPDGNAIVSGSTYSLEFPVGFEQVLSTFGNEDGFIMHINSQGEISNMNLIGGEAEDRIVAIDSLSEGIWMAGRFSTGNFSYANFLEKELISSDPLPTSLPSMPTATLAVTATYQPTETPVITITEIEQDTTDDSFAEIESTVVITPSPTKISTHTQSSTQNFEETTEGLKVTSTREVNSTEITEKEDITSNKGSSRVIIFSLGAVVLITIITIHIRMKK